MADSFYKLEDEAFPSFLSKSLDSTSGRATLGNVTLGSGPGLPVAASTVAKIRPGSDNRWVHAATLDRCDLLETLILQPPLYLTSVRTKAEISIFLFERFAPAVFAAYGSHEK